MGFDIVEISSGFIAVPADDLVRLIEKVQKAGLKAKAEVGIQFRAGAASTHEELAAEGTSDPEWAIMRARRHLEAGASMIMVESEGITESVRTWRTDVIARFVRELGLEKTMFEAADPDVFEWYVKNCARGQPVRPRPDHPARGAALGDLAKKSLWGPGHVQVVKEAPMSDSLFALVDRHEIAEGTMAFRFDVKGTGFTFKAGQYADFTLLDPPETDAEGDTRTFSIASSPNDHDSIVVATRMRPTAFKNYLGKVPLGTRAQVRGPMGAFTLRRDPSRPIVFLAGEIGITPMRSMIAWATEERLRHRIVLFYSNTTRATAAFIGDLERWATENKNFALVATVTGSRDPSWSHEFGLIGEDMLRRFLDEVRRPVYYTAGPPGMVNAMRELLEKRGVSEDDVRTEEFAGY